MSRNNDSISPKKSLDKIQDSSVEYSEEALAKITDEEWKIGAARASLTGYKYYVSPAFSHAWDARHLHYLDEKLMAVERGEIKRLMVWMPPRHYKSQSATAHFPAWYLGKHPDHKVILGSYSADLVKRFSSQSRGLVEQYGPELFDIKLSSKSSAVDNWDIEDRYGGLSAVGVGGSLTGKGANVLIIDDPHKDREEANSKVMRDKVWSWYTSTARTRLEADGAIIVIQTRWHPEDLSGMLLKSAESGDEYAEQWEVVDLAAICEKENDQLQRELGEALWPQQFPIRVLMGIKAAIGSYEWGALYQQRPADLKGGAIKADWFKWYTKSEISFRNNQWWYHDEPMILYQGVDPAISEKESADDFVIFTIGVTSQNKVILLDSFEAHLDFTEQPKAVIRKYQEWVPIRVGIETNAYQKALKQQIVKDALIPIKGLEHHTDKYTRILTMTPYFENGQVYCRQALDNEPGHYDLVRLPGIKIHKKFKKFYDQAVNYGPKAAHDDILDALENCFSIAKVPMLQNEFYDYLPDNIVPMKRNA